ncbi:hypothetical protein PENSPDRAFT_178170 [Peniophora sp. CONT]|nr:hypothetical protein PENSPDRAFT_178170 [Peniophora sp. CONT]
MRTAVLRSAEVRGATPRDAIHAPMGVGCARKHVARSPPLPELPEALFPIPRRRQHRPLTPFGIPDGPRAMATAPTTSLKGVYGACEVGSHIGVSACLRRCALRTMNLQISTSPTLLFTTSTCEQLSSFVCERSALPVERCIASAAACPRSRLARSALLRLCGSAVCGSSGL